MFKNWKIRNNSAVHGLKFAAAKWKEECKRAQKPDSFDVFYFALFGRYPTR
jgi:hypothetical protein